MNRALRIASVVVCVLLGAGTQRSAFGSSQTQTYELHMEQPQVSQAANGEMVSITGSGVFSVNPKTVSATGTFTSQSSGNGTWVATQLLDFQPYGCGIIFGTPIPPNLCGGKLMLRVVLTDSTSGQQFDGVLWVLCDSAGSFVKRVMRMGLSACSSRSSAPSLMTGASTKS